MADPWESAPIVEEAPRAGLAKPSRQPAAAAAPWDSAPVITASSALPNVAPKQGAGLAPRTGAAAVPTADEVRTGTYTPPVAPPAMPEPTIKDKVIGAAEAGIELLTQLVSAPLGIALGPIANMDGQRTGEQNAALGMQQVAQGFRSTMQAPMRALGLGVGEGMSPQGTEYTEDIGGAMANLPPVMGVHGTLAGPAGAGASGMGLRRNVQMAAEPATGLVRKVVDTVERVMPKEKAPGAEAPAGSVGAAGVDMPTQRRERAAALGVKLTKGDADRSFEQQRFEKETAKNPELGKPLRERKAEQRRAILDRFDEWVDETGANDLEANALGKGVTDPIYEKAVKAKQEVRAKYDAADEAGETAELVNYTPIRAYIEDQTPTTREKLAPILKMAEEQLAKNDPEGTGQLSIKQLNDVRQAIRANTEFGTPNSVQGGELIKLIDAATENAGGDLYKAARKAHAEYAAEFKNQGVIRDLTTLKKGTTDRKVALAQVFDRSVLKATIDDVRAVKRTLTTAGESGVQAWNDLRGKTIEWIKGEATKSAVRDERGNPVISADKLTKAVDRLDKDGRLEELFGKQGAQQLRDVADIAKDVWTSPPDAVNTSNTASVFIGALDTFATYMISGGTVPLPAVTLIKKGLQNLKDRKLKAKVRYALGPGDEVTPSPVRAFEPGKEPPPPTGPGNRGPGGGGAPRGTMPPGGRSDVQVREAERAWQEVLPDLPRELHARLAQESAVDARATTEGQRAQLRERLSAQGADPAQAVRDVLGAEGADAPRGLQPAAAGQMDLPGVPGRSLPGSKAPGREATKRERDLVGLREQATDPQVLKDLDIEIAAERRRTADAARAVEYRKLAEATGDADIKAKFTAKAEKLAPTPAKAAEPKPEPLPVPEVLELAEGDPGVDMLKMRAEGEAAWRREHRVGDLDAERMKTAWQAMEYDAPAVQRAAQQFDNSPRAFDREVQRIIDEGKARETQVNQDPGRGPGVGRPAEAAGREAGPGPQRPGPDGNAKAAAQRGAPDNEGRPAAGLTPGDSSPRFRELAEKVGKIDEQKGLTPAERGVEKRFADAVRAEPDEFLRRYDELPETRGGKVVNTDEARALWHEYDADNDSRSLNAKAVHEPSSWIAKAKWDQLLQKPPEKGTVLLLGGGGGSGKTSSLGDIAPGFESNYDAIYDTTLANQKKAVDAVQQAIDSGRTVVISYTARAPIDSIIHGIIPRAAKKGRTVPLDIAAQAHRDAPNVVKALIERYADDDRVTFQFVDNTRGPGQARLVSPSELPAFDYNQLEGRAFDAAREAYEQGKISETVLRGLVGEGESQAGQRPREGQGRSAGADDGRQLEPPRGQGSEARQGLTGSPAGYSSTALTERGLEVPFTYRLADVSQLITSHDDTLRLNPAFPQELQPRDRTRMSSEAQITKISNDIKPEFLAESPKASDGAPIVGSDAVVESGNARTIALRRAYANGKADHYRAWLRQNAERFGLKPADIDAIKQPMLVREGLGKYDRAEFARQANESPVSSMAETEVAQADAKKLPDLEGLVTNDDGSINPTQSAEFIRQFMRYVASPNEHNQLMTGDGRLSQRGAARIRNAIFSKAYGDSDIVSLLTEATDGNVRNLLAGMLRAAPDVARVRTLLEAGARAGRDFVPDLVDAVRRFGAAREASQKVEQYLAQGSMFGGEAPPAVADLMRSLEKDSRAPTRIADMIRGLVAEIDQGGDPRQPSMF